MRNLGFRVLGLIGAMLCLTGGLVVPACGQQFEKKVTLETRSNTWRDAKPLDITKDLTAKLQRAFKSYQRVPKQRTPK
jgi:hypothetical protein